MTIPDQTAMRKQLIEALRKQTTLLTKLSELLDKL